MRVEKTVFISYRRANASWALAFYHKLTQHGYDVFFDYKGLPSGSFEKGILENIRSRAHFLVILAPAALDRCDKPGDWFRREIEEAMDCGRNIVPLMLESFDFGTPGVDEKLTGKLAALKEYNGLGISVEYFDATIIKLQEQFLNVSLNAVLQPVSDTARDTVIAQQAAANAAPEVSIAELTAKDQHHETLPDEKRPQAKNDPKKKPPSLYELVTEQNTIAHKPRALESRKHRFYLEWGRWSIFLVAISILLGIWWSSDSGDLEPLPAGFPPDKAKAPIAYDNYLRCMQDFGDCGYLAHMYAVGRFVAEDDEIATDLYKKACDGGDFRACASFGRMYESGSGVAKDLNKAAELYKKACDFNDDDIGCRSLAEMYEYGKGVNQNEEVAAKLYQRACFSKETLYNKSPAAWACKELGEMYQDGRGVTKDRSKARELFTRACDASVGCS